MTMVVQLPARLDLDAAGVLAADLAGRRGNDLTLNADLLEHLSTPGLQVLLSASQTWRGAGQAIRVEGESSALSDQLAQFGLALTDLATSVQEGAE